MASLPEHAKKILEAATDLPYRIEQVPPEASETAWQVLLDPAAETVRYPGAYETIVGASGRADGEIIVSPRVKASLTHLAQKLDGKEADFHLLADRRKWSGLRKRIPHTLKFLGEMESTIEKINIKCNSDVQLHLDPEGGEWWLQVRFRSSGLSADESVERLERNVEAFSKALREYHARMESLKI